MNLKHRESGRDHESESDRCHESESDRGRESDRGHESGDGRLGLTGSPC